MKTKMIALAILDSPNTGQTLLLKYPLHIESGNCKHCYLYYLRYYCSVLITKYGYCHIDCYNVIVKDNYLRMMYRCLRKNYPIKRLKTRGV